MSDLFAMFSAMDNQDSIREDQILRALFPWPGGKSRSVEKILPHLPYRKKYGEPFGGSGAVLLSRKPSPLEVFNDRFSGVTCFYRVIRDRTKMNKLLDRLQLCLHSREEFVWCKNTWKDCEDEIERAARWWYTVTVSFAGQGRHFGRATKVKAQLGPKLKNNLKHFPEVHLRMAYVQIENQDWRMILKDYDDYEMVWYFDPPYYEYCKGMYECEMNKDDHVEMIHRIFELKGHVVLSGYENELYDKFPWDNKESWNVQVSTLGQGFTDANNLAGHEDTLKRGAARETVWIKEAA